MNSDFFGTISDNSSIELNSRSNTSDNNNIEVDQDAEHNQILQELQIKRDTRNTSEKFRDHDLPDLCSNGIDSKDNESDTTHDTSQQISTGSVESLDEAPLQLPNPGPTNTERNNLQLMSGSFMNLLQNVVSPIRQPSLPRIVPVEQTRPHRNPIFSLFTSLPLFHHNSNNLESLNNNNSELHENGETALNTQHEQPNQNQNDFNPDLMDHGAIIVRTVHPGPNGLMIVRMRVIPFDELFGGPGNPVMEGGDHLHSGLFAALFRLLSSVSDIHLERGLEKKTLDSLPVVIYDTEGFKNVDEESKTCAICCDHYEDAQEVRYLWCLHRFHKGCVDQWLNNHTTCPICKKDFSEIEKVDYE